MNAAMSFGWWLLMTAGDRAPELPPGLRDTLERAADSLSTTRIEWVHRLQTALPSAEIDALLGYEFAAKVDALAAGHSSLELSMPRYRVVEDWSGQLSAKGGSSQRIARMRQEIAYDGKYCYATMPEPIEGVANGTTLILEEHAKRYALYPELKAWTSSFLDAAGWVTSHRAEAQHRDRVRPEVLDQLHRGATLVASDDATIDGHACRRIVVSDGDLRLHYWIALELGGALLAMEERDADDQLRRRSVMTGHLRPPSPSECWLPRRIEVAHHVAPRTQVVRDDAIYTESYSLARVAFEPIDDARFVLAPNRPGMPVFSLDGELFFMPADEPQLAAATEKAIAELGSGAAPKRVRWASALVGSLVLLAFLARAIGGRRARLVLAAAIGTFSAWLLCGVAHAAEGVGAERTAILDARELRELLRRYAASVSSLSVSYDVSGYSSEVAEPGTYFHLDLSATAPDRLRCRSGHGTSKRDWHDDPYLQEAFLIGDDCVSFAERTRTFHVTRVEPGQPFPGTLRSDFYLLATGLWPCHARPAPELASGPAILLEIAADPAYDFVREELECVGERWCHVLERKGFDTLWIDVERQGALLARETFDGSTGVSASRVDLRDHRSISGVWLPFLIDARATTSEAETEPGPEAERVSRAEVRSIAIAPLDDEHFRFEPPAGSIRLKNRPDDEPNHLAAVGGSELLDELGAWIGRVATVPDERSSSPPLAAIPLIAATIVGGAIGWRFNRRRFLRRERAQADAAARSRPVVA